MVVYFSWICLVSVVFSGHKNKYEAFNDDDLKSAALWLYPETLSCKQKNKIVITYQGLSIGTKVIEMCL